MNSVLNRRELIKLGMAAAAGTSLVHPLSARPRSKTILILGGTNFVGPATVEAALEHGHSVTLFNRGITHPELFPKLEKIRGNRDVSDHSGLAALSGTRRWDAVIDVWPDDPALVTQTAELLAHRTDYYFFVSSISAYADYSKIGIEETAPTRLEKPGYGGNKARSEKALNAIFSDRCGIVRPSAILGDRDSSLSYHFWLSRLGKDEEIIAPGNGNDFVQYVDVKDVGSWIVDSVEYKRPGIYNVLSLPKPFKTFLDESRAGIKGRAQLVWINQDFLQSQGVRVFDNMPYWHPDRPGFDQISSSKARNAGWRPRPLPGTARDSWFSYQRWVSHDLEYPQKQYGFEWGLSPQREREILALWRQRRKEVA